jgi:MFS family permease
VNSPARNSIIAKLSPSKRRGLAYSLYFLPNSIIGAVAPAIAGIIAELYGFNSIFYITMGAYAFAWIIIKFMVKVE